MFGEAPGKNAGEMKFVVAFRINDDVTKQLMQRVVDSGFQPEQIARYALKRYLNELSRSKWANERKMDPQPLWREVLPDQIPDDPAFMGWYLPDPPDDANLELDIHTPPEDMSNAAPVKKDDGWYWINKNQVS